LIEWIIARSEGDRGRVGALAGVVCISLNVLLCIAKALVGILSGSVSIVADALNNLSDASSNIVSVLGFKLASKPADPEHPYGHGRFEYLSGLVVAVLVLMIGVELVKSSIDKVLNPSPVEFSLALVVVLAGSMAVKLWMAHLNRVLGERIKSETLLATAQDSKNDVIATGAVLVCAIIAYVAGIELDAWVGLAVGLYIGWSGIELIRDTVNPLLGQAPDPELVAHIRSKIMSYPGVLGTHDLMVHDYGPGRQFASAHVEMAAETDPMESHDTLDNIEQAFKDDDGLIVTLHYDPIVTNDPHVVDMRNKIDAMAKSIDGEASIHDLRCVPGPTHTNVIFDCLHPAECALSPSEFKRKLGDMVVEEYPDAVPKITVDEDYVSAEQ
jgi:cation diffusion facilitator family transporter